MNNVDFYFDIVLGVIFKNARWRRVIWESSDSRITAVVVLPLPLSQHRSIATVGATGDRSLKSI